MDDKKNVNSKVVSFIKRKKLHSEVLLLDESNADYFIPKLEPKLTGSIPATVVINNATGFRWHIEGQLKTAAELEEQIKKAQTGK